MPSALKFLHKNRLMNGGNVIDDNFRKIAVENHLEGVTKLVEGANWEKATNKVIVDNLVENPGDLTCDLNGVGNCNDLLLREQVGVKNGDFG